MKKYSTIFIIVLFATILLIFSGCQKEPIKIGFIGDLSSKNAQLAIDARNSVEYYVDNLNDEGGINGRMVQLVVKDDESNTDVAHLKHQELIEEGVKVVIGHMTSNMREAVEASSNEELLFLSPSMSTTSLSGIDDNFLRTSPLNDMQVVRFMEYATKNTLDNLVIVYDQINADYTEVLAADIVEAYDQEGLNIVSSVAFDSRVEGVGTLVERLSDTEFDNILILAQATNTAYIIQSLSQTHDDFGKYSVSWSMTDDFIINGGQVAEGTIFLGIYKPEVESTRTQSFTQGFMDQYSYEPSFISYLAYDAIDVLCTSLRTTDKIEVASIKKSIIDYGEFEGLMETFDVNDYGDSTRRYLLYRLEDGVFVPMR